MAPVTYPVQSQNQFVQSAMPGQLDLKFNPAVISAEIASTSAGKLLPGQPVKIVASSGAGPNAVPKVVECALNSDDVYGFITYDLKSASFSAGDRCEIAAMRDNVMYMITSAAITQNAKVAIVVSLTVPQVVTATSGMTIVGRAFDGAATAGQLIRVVVDLPGTTA